MNNSPVSEVTDSGQRGSGDSKDVWDHVSIETVNTFYTILSQFMRYVLTQKINITVHLTNKRLPLWPMLWDEQYSNNASAATQLLMM